MRVPKRRYAAFLRGVSPMNLQMIALKACLEKAGFSDVKTLLSSGNATFSAVVPSEGALEKKIEAALKKALGREFMTLVRSIDALQELLASDPFRPFGGPAGAKRVVTFLREPPARLPKLPIEFDGVRILRVLDREVLSDYVVGPRGPVFMTLLQKTFGEGITTRTWDTVRKVAASSPAPGASGNAVHLGRQRRGRAAETR